MWVYRGMCTGLWFLGPRRSLRPLQSRNTGDQGLRSTKLFESLPDQWEVKQHLIKFWEVRFHFLRDLVVHKFTNSTALIFDLFVWIANYDGLNWPPLTGTTQRWPWR